MANKIQFKRGLTVGTPNGGLAGEPLFDSEAGRFYIAKDATNKYEFANRSLVLEKSQNLNDLADKPTARTNLGVYSKTEVDNLVNGLVWKISAKASTTGNITLSGEQTIDGIPLVAGDRALVKDQTLAENNGVYVVASGSWVRASDCDSEAELLQMAIFVNQGTVNADTGWVLTTDSPIVVGTTDLTYSQFSGLGSIIAGTGLTKTGNQIDLDITELVAETVNANADLIAIYDVSASAHRKMTRSDFLSGFDSDTKQVKVTASDTTEGYLFDSITAGIGIVKTVLNPGANETLQIRLGFSSITAQPSTIASTDYVPYYSVTDGAERTATINEFISDAIVDGGVW